MLSHRLDAGQGRPPVEAGEFTGAADQQSAMGGLFHRQPHAEPMLAFIRIQFLRMVLGDQITGAEQDVPQHRRQRLRHQDLPPARLDGNLKPVGGDQFRCPDAGGIDDNVGPQRSLCGLNAADFSVLHNQALRLDAGANLRAQPASGLGKALRHPDRIDLGVFLAIRGAPQIFRQKRFAAPCLGDRQQLDRQARRLLFLNQSPQQRRLFFRFGDDHAAAGHIFEIIIQFRRQGPVHGRAFQRQVQMRSRILRLQDDEPVAGAGGACRDIAAIQQEDFPAGFRRIVGDRGTDDAAADNNDFRSVTHRLHLPPGHPAKSSAPAADSSAAGYPPATAPFPRRSPGRSDAGRFAPDTGPYRPGSGF